MADREDLQRLKEELEKCPADDQNRFFGAIDKFLDNVVAQRLDGQKENRH